MNIAVQITKRHMLYLSLCCALLITTLFVLAYNSGSSPAVFGHSLEEIGLNVTCSGTDKLTSNGTAITCGTDLDTDTKYNFTTSYVTATCPESPCFATATCPTNTVITDGAYDTNSQDCTRLQIGACEVLCTLEATSCTVNANNPGGGSVWVLCAGIVET